MRTNFVPPLIAAALAAMAVSAHANGPAVTRDRIVLHEEFAPRFASYLRDVLVVPAGRTVTLPQASTWDAIEVAGTLRVARTRDTVVSFTHLTILPGGTLDVGTVEDPIPCGFRAEFIIRNIPIDTARDPFQWGNGIINLGHQSRVGCAVEKAWTELAEDAEAGATSLHLAVPAGWKVGDELLLPDLRQIHATAAPIRRESKVTIAAVGDGVIMLSKPLDFEHRSITDPEGAVVVRPRVANLTRNIVIRSENPADTRGHSVNTGHATWDIRYNRLIGLGRTRAENLNSTTAEPTGAITHVGTNQIARYASHDHHVQGHGRDPLDRRDAQFIGNVLQGDGNGKWGHVVHGTHDTHVEDNIAIDFQGAGFVTEDGYEVRNVFRRNVAIGSTGNGISGPGNVDSRAGRDCPGCEGAGFWFRGPQQTIEGNEAWNNFIGINLFNMAQVRTAVIPSIPGGTPDTPFDPQGKAVPFSFADNVTLSNATAGLEYWSTPRFAALRQISANNGEKQMFAGASAGVNVYLVDPVLVETSASPRTDGIGSSEAYVQGLEVEGGYIGGCRQAFQRGGAGQFVRLKNITLQCVSNINFSGRFQGFAPLSVYENLLHKPLMNFPKRYIVLGNGYVYRHGEPVPTLPARVWIPSHGSRHLVKNWQGTGQDFRLYENQSRYSAAAWPAITHWPYCPEENMTVGQCWQKYGLGFGGDAVPETEEVQLEGLVNGVARAGVATALGAPKAVLTFPNMMAAAKVETINGRQGIRLKVVLTGDPTRAKKASLVSIDGGKPQLFTRGGGQFEDETSFFSFNVSPGTHIVRTWRVDESNTPISGSELRFAYFVAAPAQMSRRDLTTR